MIEVAMFPIAVTSDEGDLQSYETVQQLEMSVEFLDQWQWDYTAYDAKVRRVRLIVWDLQLLVCQALIEDEDLTQLRVQAASHMGHHGRAECLADGTVVRFLADNGGMVLPRIWTDDVVDVLISADAETARSEYAARAFHEDWMRVRLGHFP